MNFNKNNYTRQVLSLSVGVLASLVLGGSSYAVADSTQSKEAKSSLYHALSTPAYASYQEEMEFHGRVAGHQSITKSFIAGGRLEALNIVEGDKVKEGDILARLYSPGFSESLENASNLVGKAEANLRLTSDEERRASTLLKKKVISAQEYGKFKRDLQVSQYELEQAESGYRQIQNELSDLSIIAPTDGVVTRIYKTEGEFLNPGETVLQFESTQRLKAVFFVPESVAVTMRTGQEHELYFPVSNENNNAIVTEMSRPSVGDLPLHRVTFELQGANSELIGFRTTLLYKSLMQKVYKIDYRAIRYDIDNKPFVVKNTADMETIRVEIIDLNDDVVIVKSDTPLSDDLVIGSDFTIPLAFHRMNAQ